jgi:tRNA pseudouridine55 synthase
MYSALKHQGKKLYELARKGKTVERKPRKVTISALELGERRSDTDWALTVKCSKGTYIRTLCHDIGAALGCGGTMAALRRTEAAGFTLSDAVTLEEVEQAAQRGEAAGLLRSVDSLFSQYQRLDIYGRKEQLCRNGNPFRLAGENGTFRFYGEDGSFLMLGRREDGQVRTIKSFF